MGLFDKKFCDICGEKISLLGNRKLEDGNMCSSCAKLISPFMTDRRQTTVAEMKEHLAGRQANKQALAVFSPNESYGDNKKIYIDRAMGTFVVSINNPSSWANENPDVIPLSEITFVNLDIREDREEIFTKDAQGNRQRFNPPRYKLKYDFYIIITLNDRWFDKIEIKLNLLDVEGYATPKYHNFEMMGQQIVAALTAPVYTPQPAFQPAPPQFEDPDEAKLRELEAQAAKYANMNQEEMGNVLKAAMLDTLVKFQTEGVPEENRLKCPSCETFCSGAFCPNCGTKTVAPIRIICRSCGYELPMQGILPKFCSACGHQFDADDMKMQ